MASIDEVIERSREPGEFSERREFTVARGRAIQKLREFALVDPHYYILELIQSAVANGATYIDIRCDDDSVALSYIGGNFREMELAQLFDFLFAAQDDVEHGPLRQLALGVNALMRFEPDEIIIETGDGTLPGTTRIVIREDDDTVEVGRPEAALEGTFLRATGMRRREMQRNSSLERIEGHPREFHAVEKRCLVAPVPILFNHDPLFGYSRQRTPKSLLGFQRTVAFDEGDFYGAIGVARQHTGAVFRLLTHGVWIESTRHEFPTDGGSKIDTIGGVITFDRLRKTADHSAIVDDERYHEMWLRLRPYVNQLVSGQTRADDYDVRTLAGDRIDNRELLDLLRSSDTLVMVPTRAASQERYFEPARRIGESLDVPVLCVPDERREALQALGGSDVHFITPDLDDQREVRFYTQQEASLPPRPWLISATELGTSSLLDIVERVTPPKSVEFPEPSPDLPRLLSDDTPLTAVQKAVWFLGEKKASEQMPEDWKKQHLDTREECVRARIFTPVQRGRDRRDTNVEVRAAGRVVWSGDDESIPPGQVLIIDVSDIAPGRLWASPEGTDRPVAQWIAESVVALNVNEIQAATDRALRAALRADVQPGDNAARLILASLSQRVVKRIRSVDGHRQVAFSIVDLDLDPAVLDTPVLTTLAGDHVSLRGIEDLLRSGHGLLYGVRTDRLSSADAKAPDLGNLDRGQILVVDAALEQLLISLVGPTAYVAIDDRDVLAEFDTVRCRTPAVGLREVPDFPLLVEGDNPATWTAERQKKCLDALVSQLVDLVTGDAEDAAFSDRRRQGWRHLQWFAAHRRDFEFADEAGETVDALPLFRLAPSGTCSFATLRRVIDHQGHVEMLDGWAVGAGEMPYTDAADSQVLAPDAAEEMDSFLFGHRPFLLSMNPFVLHLLGDAVRGAAEYHLSPREADAVDEPDVSAGAMLEYEVIDTDEAAGVVGLPIDPVDRPAVLVFGADQDDVVLREDIGETWGVVGKLRLRTGVSHDDVESTIAGAASDVLGHLLTRIPELSSADDATHYERALSALLDYAAGRTRLIGRPDMTIDVDVGDPLARQILNAPLFDGADGLPVSTMSLYRDFQDQAPRALTRDEQRTFQPRVLAPEFPDALQSWMNRHLNLNQVHRPNCPTDSAGRNVATNDDEALCAVATLEHWLNTLYDDAGTDDGFQLFVEPAHRDFFAGNIESGFCQLTQPFAPDVFVLKINSNHWMTHWLAREGKHSARPIAWALLSACASINNALDRVTNRHELISQRRLAEVLDRDRLELVEAPSE